MILEFYILIETIIIGMKNKDSAVQKNSLAFGFLFLSRYILIFFLYFILNFLFQEAIPNTIAAAMAFIVLIYQNLVPLLWFHFYFLPYAESLSNILDRKEMLESLFEKYQVSKREQEIIRLIVDGKSNADIEKILFISMHTVKNHIYRIYRKFNVNTRYELIHLITRFGEREK